MLFSTPHGGKLINRVLSGEERTEKLQRAKELTKVPLNEVAISDLQMIAIGAMSPLTGFMNKEDYDSVVDSVRLKNGAVWSLPITLPVSDEIAASVKIGDEIALIETNGEILATMTISDKYKSDKKREAKKVYRTDDEAHPGVARVISQGDTNLAGDIFLLNSASDVQFQDHQKTPAELRKIFTDRGWKTVVGFQTRNPIHRAHEFLTKCALEIVDGLLIHPLVGHTKSDDIPADVRMTSYKALLDNYYPADRVMLSVFPAAMRYAGPREAIFHAIARKNYGCTHFIVGRDHAGVGNYYGTYDAQDLFDEFTADELGITPLKFEHAFYCKRNQAMATNKTSSSSADERIFLSGTKVRELLRNGELPPAEFTRPEVAKILIDSMKNS